MRRLTVAGLVDLLVRLYRAGEVCPRCAAVVGVEFRRRFTLPLVLALSLAAGCATGPRPCPLATSGPGRPFVSTGTNELDAVLLLWDLGQWAYCRLTQAPASQESPTGGDDATTDR